MNDTKEDVKANLRTHQAELLMQQTLRRAYAAAGQHSKAAEVQKDIDRLVTITSELRAMYYDKD